MQQAYDVTDIDVVRVYISAHRKCVVQEWIKILTLQWPH